MCFDVFPSISGQTVSPPIEPILHKTSSVLTSTMRTKCSKLNTPDFVEIETENATSVMSAAAPVASGGS